MYGDSIQYLRGDTDAILRIIPLPGLHHICQAFNLDAISTTVLASLAELPLADQRPHHHCRCLGCRNHPDCIFPLRANGEKLAPDGEGHLHTNSAFLLWPANPEHHHGRSHHRRSYSGSHALAAQQEAEDWSCDHVRIGHHHPRIRHRSPRGSVAA